MSSTCTPIERSILTKLKQQCGAQFTSKMEGMVTDLQLARDNQACFEQWMEEVDTRWGGCMGAGVTS